MTSLGELYSHRPYFGNTTPIGNTDSVKEGDVITFLYDGQVRWVYVLNPDWKKKLHCITLTHISRRMLLGEIVSFRDVNLDGGEGPKQFYDKHVGTPPVYQLDGYRTFNIEKMQKIQKIEYVLNQVTWTVPNLTELRPALALAAQRFGIDQALLEQKATAGMLLQLPDAAWARLKNSMSYSIPINGFFQIGQIYGGTSVTEDLKTLEEAFRTGGEIDAPVILFIGDNTEQTPYLVAGEIKMMYARASGVIPRVYLISMATKNG